MISLQSPPTPHAAGWRTKSKTTLFFLNNFNCPSIFWSAVSGGWCESEVLSLAQYGRKILFKCGRKLDNVIRFFQRQISTVRPTFWRIATLRHRKFVSLAFWITLIFWNSLRWWVVTYRWKSPSVLKLKHYKNYGSKFLLVWICNILYLVSCHLRILRKRGSL